jgi:hypothetical protein
MKTKIHPTTYRKCDATTITDRLTQAIAQVQDHAQTRGYRQTGDIPTAAALHAGVQAATQTLRKRLLKRVERLQKKTNLRSANQFLHLVCIRLLAYGPEAQVARVDVSEQEAAIRAARQAWLKARSEAEAKRLAYVAEKGDFYRRSV